MWGDGYTDLTLLSQTQSLFPGSLDGEWEGRPICRSLCLGEGEDVVCRAEVKFENA